jgi:hypothetical protein
MSKETTLKKLETLLTDAERNGTWSVLEIEIKSGRPTLLRQTIQTKLTDEDNPDARSTYPRK